MTRVLSPTAIYAGRHPLANYGRRYQAQLIDTIVVAPAWGAAALALLFDSLTASIGMLVVGVFVLPGIYETISVARTGQTLGKRIVGIRVVGLDGHPIGWTRASLRSVFKFATLIPPVVILQATSWIVGVNNQTLHDRAAGTVVVRIE